MSASMVARTWLESSADASSSASSHVLGASAPSPELFFGPKREPLLVKAEDGGFEGLGGKLPGKHFTVADVGRLVGMDRMVDVIGQYGCYNRGCCTEGSADVATQQSSQWPLSKWVEYIASRHHPISDPGPSTKTFNIISLEISGTDLAKKVRPPRLVSEIDWVDNCWNFGTAGKHATKEASEHERHQHEDSDVSPVKSEVKPDIKGKAPVAWPKVQLYCLVSEIHIEPDCDVDVNLRWAQRVPGQ